MGNIGSRAPAAFIEALSDSGVIVVGEHPGKIGVGEKTSKGNMSV